MLNKFIRVFGGDPNKREIEKLYPLVDQINRLEADYEALSDEALRLKTDEFRQRLAQGETLDDIMIEAFAAVREASKRTIGLRHYDVQLIGGAVLHRGNITEMRTGEGKTLVATLPLYLNALRLNPAWVERARRKWGDDPAVWQFEVLDGLPLGLGVHLVTVNDYLARRDARWMGPIFAALGLSIGVLQMAARTENGKKAFLVDLERRSPHEDQHQLRMVPRREAYLADITYGTNSEFGFDYLRDNMTMSLAERVQRGHHYAIIDEVDNILIDEARTPLIISGPATDNTEWYVRMAQVVKQLRPEDYEINERDRTVTLSEIGEAHVEELLGLSLRDPERPEDVTPEQARLLGFLEQALRAQFLFHRNKDYLVQGRKVIIIDEFTGRLMPGRRWSDGLHQAVEAKEGVPVQADNITYATITIQNYFRMYEKLAGMTGTAATEAEEFSKIYKLDVVILPTNLEYNASREDSELVTVEAKDEAGYKYTYYALKNDPQKHPVFWKRKDYPDVIYRSEEAKLRAIVAEILRYHVLGNPLLVGTTSVELSDRLSNRLRAEPLRRLAMTLLLRDAWFTRNNRSEDGRRIPELSFLNAPLDDLPIAEVRRMARQLGISSNPEDDDNLSRLSSLLNIPQSEWERLTNALKAGIPHQVLNAREHTRESQIIAGAGAYGAVTIATSMAGRGVDIKLGGELAEEVLSSVNRVLRRAGYPNPYNMTHQARRQALLEMDRDDYGIYEDNIQIFLKYMEDMERVKALGGLHIVGSERHEARRIDNQLRGRAARQGDPGSSRFYLSMEDELMRLFGGQQADSLMQRINIDDSFPLEFGLVGRLIEQAQTRVEGANFDTRKHLLEYDDVLNAQRASIYAQRDRIFVKSDLSEDVTEMLRTEVLKRVPEALEDQEGPWKLLSWLEQIQPTMILNRHVFPSYTYKLLTEEVAGAMPLAEARRFLLDTAQRAVKAEQEHLMSSVQRILETTQEHLRSQYEERLETLNIFFDQLESEEGESGLPGLSQISEELSSLMHLPIRLSGSQQRLLYQNPKEIRSLLQDQVETALLTQGLKRLLGAINRRLSETLELTLDGLLSAAPSIADWDVVARQVTDAVQRWLEASWVRFFDPQNGLVIKDLDNYLAGVEEKVAAEQLVQLLLFLTQGVRTTFDRKTHRQVRQRTTRLSYTYYAARLLEGREPGQVADDVLSHLEKAQQAIQQLWGMAELSRLGNYAISELDEKVAAGLRSALSAVTPATHPTTAETVSETALADLETWPLRTLPPTLLPYVAMELGRQALTEIYRQLLLRVISGEWVEYLTQMEALRVAIGLEAYGQRDPLVQYKGRASEMFNQLLANIRLGVVTRMFTFQPQEIPAAQTAAGGRQESPTPQLQVAEKSKVDDESAIESEEAEQEVEAQGEPSVAPSVGQVGLSKSAKRRRRRR